MKNLILTIGFLAVLSLSIVFASPAQPAATVVSEAAKVLFCSAGDSQATCDVTKQLFSGTRLSNMVITQRLSSSPSPSPSIVPQPTQSVLANNLAPTIEPTNLASFEPSATAASSSQASGQHANTQSLPSQTAGSTITKVPTATVAPTVIPSDSPKSSLAIVCSQTNLVSGASVNLTDLPNCESSPEQIALSTSPHPADVASRQPEISAKPAGEVLAKQTSRSARPFFVLGGVGLLSVLILIVTAMKYRLK